MPRRLIENDPYLGVSVYHNYDPQTDITTIEQIQDCQSIIESNKAVQNLGTPGGRFNEYERAGIKASWVHAATIPVTIIQKWKDEDGIDVFDKNHIGAVKKKLRDPEWRYLRTGNMRV